jgi:hypothetical protein
MKLFNILFASFALLGGVKAVTKPSYWLDAEKTIAITADTVMSRGASDKNGDYKAIESTIRKNGHVFSLKTSLRTTQSLKAADMRDTAFGQVSYGRETDKWGAYISLGTTRNGMPDFMYNTVDGAHSILGMGQSRKSKLSNAPSTTVSLAGRRDYVWEKPGCVRTCFSLHTTAFGVLGNVETHAGIAVYGVVSLKSAKRFRAPIEGMPMPGVSGTHFYAGVRVKAVAFDRAVEGRINPYRAELVAGVEHRRRKFGIGLEFSHALTREIYGVRQPAVSKVMVRLSWAF